jgi:hypothetical protein
VITFYLPRPSRVTLNVDDGLGRVVSNMASGEFLAGHHNITLDATALPAGIYICHFMAGTYSEKIKLILHK